MDFEDNNKNNNMKFSVVETYGEDLTAKKFITNPAIAPATELGFDFDEIFKISIFFCLL